MRRWPDWERSRTRQINPTLTPPAPIRAFRERLDHDAQCQKVQQFGGEGGIRTLGTGYPVRQISNLVPSTTRPPLRTIKSSIYAVFAFGTTSKVSKKCPRFLELPSWYRRSIVGRDHRGS